MKTFKEQMQSDLDDVFFNIDEFAEEIEINGQKVIGVFSPYDVDPYKSLEESGRNGIVERLNTLLFKTVDTPPRLFVSGSIKVNGEKWLIKSINDNLGVTKLLLYAARGR